MGNDWYWVESQKSKLSGIVNKELIQELVSDFLLFPVTSHVSNFNIQLESHRTLLFFQNGNVDPVEDYLWFHHETTKAVARDVLAKGIILAIFRPCCLQYIVHLDTQIVILFQLGLTVGL